MTVIDDPSNEGARATTADRRSGERDSRFTLRQRPATGLTSEQNIDRAKNAIRVLIVEDEALVALDMAMILDAAGCDVVATKPTGESALATLASAAADGALPDLVLLDIALRGELDGVATSQQIKRRYGALSVGFVTGQADPATRTRAEETRPAGYLLKPFTPEQLVGFVQRMTK